jgi:hypothetical protein
VVGFDHGGTEVIMAGKLAAWLQVIGNFGLILGLMLVAIQIRQSSDLARVQMGHDAWLLEYQLQWALMGENSQAVLARIRLDSESLTDEELVAADSYFQGLAFSAKRVKYVNDAGLNLYSQETLAQSLARLLSNRVGLAWWALNRDAVAADAPRFRDRIDELLAMDALDAPTYHERFRAEIEK